jgi:hypothetical protein
MDSIAAAEVKLQAKNPTILVGIWPVWAKFRKTVARLGQLLSPGLIGTPPD